MWCVTRLWIDGNLVVEISPDFLKFAASEALDIAFRNEGEGKKFADPRLAVEAGIAVAEAWAKVKGNRRAIKIAMDDIGEMSLSKKNYEILRECAKADYADEDPENGYCQSLFDTVETAGLEGGAEGAHGADGGEGEGEGGGEGGGGDESNGYHNVLRDNDS